MQSAHRLRQLWIFLKVEEGKNKRWVPQVCHFPHLPALWSCNKNKVQKKENETLSSEVAENHFTHLWQTSVSSENPVCHLESTWTSKVFKNINTVFGVLSNLFEI